MGITLATKVTFVRILAIPFFIMMLLCYTPEQPQWRSWAFLIFILAMLSDLLDGYIAKTFHQQSPLGAVLDPIADKLLILSALILLSVVSFGPEAYRFPFWVLGVVLGRDGVLFLTALFLLRGKDHQIERLLRGDMGEGRKGIAVGKEGQLLFAPTVIGKLTTFVQVLAISGIFLQWAWAPWCWRSMVVLVIISGIDYLIKAYQWFCQNKV